MYIIYIYLFNILNQVSKIYCVYIKNILKTKVKISAKFWFNSRTNNNFITYKYIWWLKNIFVLENWCKIIKILK